MERVIIDEERPEFAPWIKSRTAEDREIDDAIFFAAASAPLTPQGTFHVGAFRVLLRHIQQRATERPDRTEEAL